MKHFYTRIRQLREILDSYKYPTPFSNHLKQYFQHHKQLGGRDRKEIRALSYAFFRISSALEGESLEDIVKYAAVFLGYYFGDEVDAKLNEKMVAATSVIDKVAVFTKNIKSFDPSFLFPFSEYVSENFQNQEFQSSFLEQPKVWVKIRKGLEEEVLEELQQSEIPYKEHIDNILSFESEARLTDLKSYKEGYFWIQDLSSQQTADYFKAKKAEFWWDCCAGAGGKSLALLEKEPGVYLYASDLRAQMLNNLTERLPKPSKNKINIFAANISKPLTEQKLPSFDGIIVDAPCSGSGTWQRNPEHLNYFNPSEIKIYQDRQLAILNNVYGYLKTGKPLIYITCSVFKMENEDVIDAFEKNHTIQIEEQKYLEGYKHSSENMFLCRMIKKD